LAAGAAFAILARTPPPEDAMTDQPPRRLFRQPHRRRPVLGWVLALVLILAVMVLLPRLLARLG
jgi:hypothetical protein